MTKEKHKRTSILRSQIMSAVSVGLVLLLLGVTALCGLAVRNVANELEKEIGITVTVCDTVGEQRAKAIGAELERIPGVAGCSFVSADDVLHRWNVMMGGADSLLTAEAFLAEWDVRMQPGHTDGDELKATAEKIRNIAGVEDVAIQQDMAEGINSTIDTGTVVFVVLASILGVISFVLISNTVRLAVYARRNTIHAMRLVGATRGFIRRPFVMSALLEGLAAAAGASVILAAGLFYAGTYYPWIASTIGWDEAAWIFAGLFVTGALLCTCAALFATNRYLRIGYDRYFN